MTSTMRDCSSKFKWKIPIKCKWVILSYDVVHDNDNYYPKIRVCDKWLYPMLSKCQLGVSAYRCIPNWRYCQLEVFSTGRKVKWSYNIFMTFLRPAWFKNNNNNILWWRMFNELRREHLTEVLGGLRWSVSEKLWPVGSNTSWCNDISDIWLRYWAD